MKHLRPLSRLALLALTSLSGCATGTARTEPPVVVTDAQAGTTLELAKRQRLTIRLPANPSTGYSWEETAPPQAAVLKAGRPAEFESAPNPTRMVGVGGTTVFHYTATGPGQTQLRFEYRRPWEKGVPPVQTVQYTVSVR
jgi:inhibitor of cysteine peptidase